ncbi:MAG TPA: SCP2 sterol-binding domain-containing protein [Rhodanobacteraceae bacterium]|nr:SCP2 sterol-binding domain-containing protein [Rhodanobacteraceae bacterium]
MTAESASPNPVLTTLGRALESVLNRLVDLDPETRLALRELDGRAITLSFRDTPFAMRIAVAGDRLTIGPAFEGDSGLRVAASPFALLGLALASGRNEGVTPGKIEIAGDADLARRVERIASRFAPDFDEAFARAFGDVAGFRIARALRSALAGTRNASRAFARDAATFLTEESRDLVAKVEIEEFLDEVDQLRERADRVEARVRRVAVASGKPAA